ncbi:oligosaccharide flippase family protein [Rhodoferax sp.]|uniref:oligosaccharide flippase family protein n=1 Tax=Rhodoferax sp. TaxID=50421 RepID=UPI0025FD4B07|nr:oligosaccharide flippase family protein [Rhodoferax sp.]
MLRIATGSLASQAIVIGATPILTRLYGPEEFGALAVFAAAYAIFVGLITLKYDYSIILPRNHDKAVDLTVLTLSISLVLSLIFLALLGVSHLSLGVPMQWYFFLLPLSTILGSAYTCAQQWCARASDYRPFARSQVMNSLVNVGTSVLLAIATAKLSGSLVMGFVAGLTAGLLYISIKFLRSSVGNRFLNFRLSRLANTAMEFKRFPLYVLPSSLLATLGMNAPPFLFQTMFSLQEVGYYAIANRFLMVPSSLVGGAVAEAFRAEFVDRHKLGIKNAVFFRNTLRKLVLVALPIFGSFSLIAPSLFALLLGETYRDSGVLSRYLCIGVLAQFISQPFHYVFVATGHVRLGLFIQSALTVLPVLAIILGGLSGSMERAVLFAALLTFVLSVLLVGLAYRCCKHSDSVATGEVEHA